MTRDEIAAIYHAYIECLNRQDWDSLHRHVGNDVHYNGKRIGLKGYRSMLEEDFRAIPDLSFNVELLVCEPPQVASRLRFDCTPVGILFDVPVNGKRVKFDENVFYEIADGRIQNVWSVIDKAAIAAQI
ncbi:ester cyclase [Mesorhizobium xinjiangense]|uniref:ester cyclase n=1 Tax=Mesorhizobium xinjiangense TaxID=2678685 RepID=UPI0012ED0799|nr:ester cyclase [Mesorhizobium xinjiangense]